VLIDGSVVASDSAAADHVGDLGLQGSAGADDEAEDDEDLGDASGDGCSEGDEGGEQTDDTADDASSESEEEQPTQGADSQHCPGCGWCDAERMVGCEVVACSQWYHVHCLRLTKEEADQLSDPDFLWLCPGCDPDKDDE
jgi:hypothetical protein